MSDPLPSQANDSSPRSNLEQVRALQQEFLSGLPRRLEELERVWHSLDLEGHDQAVLRTLHRLCHTVAGEGAMLGFFRLSAAAESVERRLRDVLDQRAAAFTQPELARLLLPIQDSARQHAREPLPPVPSHLLGGDDTPDVRRGDCTLLVVEDDVEAANGLRLLLEHFGYRVVVAHSLDAAREMVNLVEPTILIMDIVLPEGDLAGIEFAAELAKEKARSRRVIFTSSRADLPARLNAIRAGGCAYFTKPIEINNLVERIDTLTGHSFDTPHQILIIEDDELQAEVHARTLRSAGLEVTVITDPMTMLDRLQESAPPDLILLDLYMPECDGTELAAVLRQHERYLSIPIVFLSSEGDLDRQVEALRAGGDEFLTKPIEPRHLLATVIPRAQRGRALRSLLYQDGLTGLIGYSKHKEQLETALATASATGGTLAYAMLDIDHFKAINDQFGHACGDRVLRSLARSLRSRLRHSDSIGRCGGDEFGVILPDTDSAGATALMERVREAFSQVRHRAGERLFHATISIGISAFPAWASTELLIDAADKALYEAKNQGRNRVVLRTVDGS